MMSGITIPEFTEAEGERRKHDSGKRIKPRWYTRMCLSGLIAIKIGIRRLYLDQWTLTNCRLHIVSRKCLPLQIPMSFGRALLDELPHAGRKGNGCQQLGTRAHCIAAAHFAIPPPSFTRPALAAETLVSLALLPRGSPIWYARRDRCKWRALCVY